jgi:hypothetical protein
MCFPRYGLIRLKVMSSIRMSFSAKLLYDGPDMQRSSSDYRQKEVTNLSNQGCANGYMIDPDLR